MSPSFCGSIEKEKKYLHNKIEEYRKDYSYHYYEMNSRLPETDREEELNNLGILHLETDEKNGIFFTPEAGRFLQ